VGELLKRVANLAATTAAEQWLEWRVLKNAETDRRAAIDAAVLFQREAAARRETLREQAVFFALADSFYDDVQQFFNDCMHQFRRTSAAFDVTGVMMVRSRTLQQTKAVSRERWDALRVFGEQLFQESITAVKHFYTESRLTAEIASATRGYGAPENVMVSRTATTTSGSSSSNNRWWKRKSGDASGDNDSNNGNVDGATALLCTTNDSSLGATMHAVRLHRQRRLLMMAQEQDRILQAGNSPTFRSRLCTTGMLAGDALSSTIFEKQS
jgi:hypothetical protein